MKQIETGKRQGQGQQLSHGGAGDEGLQMGVRLAHEFHREPADRVADEKYARNQARLFQAAGVARKRSLTDRKDVEPSLIRRYFPYSDNFHSDHSPIFLPLKWFPRLELHAGDKRPKVGYRSCYSLPATAT